MLTERKQSVHSKRVALSSFHIAIPGKDGWSKTKMDSGASFLDLRPRRLRNYLIVSKSWTHHFIEPVCGLEISESESGSVSARSCWRSPRRVICPPLLAWVRRRVFGSADHSGADRTIGSSRSSAGVSGMPSASAPSYGIESSFCKATMARSRQSWVNAEPRRESPFPDRAQRVSPNR
jgi:hypothetical protein